MRLGVRRPFSRCLDIAEATIRVALKRGMVWGPKNETSPLSQTFEPEPLGHSWIVGFLPRLGDQEWVANSKHD